MRTSLARLCGLVRPDLNDESGCKTEFWRRYAGLAIKALAFLNHRSTIIYVVLSFQDQYHIHSKGLLSMEQIYSSTMAMRAAKLDPATALDLARMSMLTWPSTIQGMS